MLLGANQAPVPALVALMGTVGMALVMVSMLAKHSQLVGSVVLGSTDTLEGLVAEVARGMVVAEVVDIVVAVHATANNLVGADR
eukprot:COSAG05_NODE_5829_length_1078_cov_1.595506_1_plen_84_part_00